MKLGAREKKINEVLSIGNTWLALEAYSKATCNVCGSIVDFKDWVEVLEFSKEILEKRVDGDQFNEVRRCQSYNALIDNLLQKENKIKQLRTIVCLFITDNDLREISSNNFLS